MMQPQLQACGCTAYMHSVLFSVIWMQPEPDALQIAAEACQCLLWANS